MRRKLTGQASSAHTDFSGRPNPLLRDCDIRQARVKHWVTVLLIVMIPVSLWIGLGAYDYQQQRLADQNGSIHQVTATTTASAQPPSVASTDFGSSGAAAATAVESRWVHRGVEHTGRVSVDTGSPVGTTTQIWVDDSGNPSVRPLTSSDVVAASIFNAIGSWVLAAVILIGLYFVVRFQYDGRRIAEWDRDIADLLSRH